MNLEINNSEPKKNDNSDFSNELKNHLYKYKESFSIDRFEGDFAVCQNLETNEFVNISKDKLPENCQEGSIIILENDIYTLDLDKTNKKQQEIKNLVNSLFKRK